jgi:hypothetical protein
MNLDKRNQEPEDAQVEEALRHFRNSVRAWSEQEFARPRTVRRSAWSQVWRMIGNPASNWAMAVALLASSVGIPVAVHHERQVAEQHRIDEQNRQKELAAKLERERAAQAIDDADLLSDVDSDIAQETPEAMQPLASLMSDTTATQAHK